MKLTAYLISIFSLVFIISCQSSEKKYGHHMGGGESLSAPAGETYISNPRQITFAGVRSGEGYFSADGKEMIFQSERHPGNPFYQIYLTDFETGKTHRVSPGHGKTTCAWIHPSKNQVLFSSTHTDPRSKSLQKEEYEIRASGKQRRYAWDYDENYDIYVSTKKGGRLKNLTRTKGYDAEASFSPDGQWIAFASNRLAYSSKMSPEDEKAFKRNASHMMDIYIMKSDGSQVKQLTTHKGYDGGPFFSPDGKRIVWRRFATDGHTAEVFTMNIDGSDKKQLTNAKAMSWAPFYHPSGDYIIYTTSVHGHHNFELYAVDTEGTKRPIRISYSQGFDGLPVFTPDGHRLTWSKKLANGQSQIFMADWNDQLVRQKLGLPHSAPTPAEYQPEINISDLRRQIYYLSSPALKGRKTGSPEEKVYTDEIAKAFKAMGLKPYGTNGSYFQEFDFLSDLTLGKHNHLVIEGRPGLQKLELHKDWAPLSFSVTGSQKAKGIAFAGYGIVAPGTETIKPYDSFNGVDVQGKWVMVFRYLPEDASAKLKQHLQRYSSLPSKVMAAKVRGAAGVIFVSGPNSNTKAEVIDFKKGSVHAPNTVPIVSVSDKLAESLLGEKYNLKDLQKELDSGNSTKAFEVPGVTAAAHISINHKMAKARNVLAILPVRGAKGSIVIGGHGDHLGEGPSNSSLMNSKDTSQIHYGADDNASGVAGTLELAHYFSDQYRKGKVKLRQNLIFSVWSGEEIGVLGSRHFTQYDSLTNKKRKTKLNKSITAYINMDMIGRLSTSLSVQGVGSSDDWSPIIERLSQEHQVPLITQMDPYLPTDASSFYLADIPVLSFFTGVHTDYHTPRDTAEKINYQGTYQTVSLIGDLTQTVASSYRGPKYNKVHQKHNMKSGGREFRISLGTIPDYSQNKSGGVLLSGVAKGGAAELAGLKSGDRIIKFSEFKIENIYDYVYSLQAVKPDVKTTIVVLRDGKKKELEITPRSKD